MNNVIVITGASSGFGALAARALAIAGHTVYASMRETTGRNAAQVEAAQKFAVENKVDLRTIELDVASQESANQAIKTIVGKEGRLDVVIHNAGHMVFGPAEAFTPEQLIHVFDSNVLSTQRVMPRRAPTTAQTEKGTGSLGRKHQHTRRHAAIPRTLLRSKGGNGRACCHLCRRAQSLGHRNLHHLPGAFTSGTNHFAHAVSPADKACQAEYDNSPYAHLGDDIMKGFAAIAPADADVNDVAKATVRVVGMPFGERPFRVHIDPAQDGAEIVNGVADRVRAEMYRAIGLSDLLTPVMP